MVIEVVGLAGAMMASFSVGLTVTWLLLRAIWQAMPAIGPPLRPARAAGTADAEARSGAGRNPGRTSEEGCRKPNLKRPPGS